MLQRLPAGASTSRTRISACWSTSTCRGSHATRGNRRQLFWAQIDVDVMKSGSPMWSFPSQSAAAGQQRTHPRAIARSVRQKASPAFRQAASARARSWRRQDKRDQRVAELASMHGAPGAINALTCAPSCRRALHPRTSSSARRHATAPAVTQQISRPLPARWCASAAAGLARRAAWRWASNWRARPDGDPDRRRRQLYFNVPTRSLPRRRNTRCRSSPSCSTMAAGRR